MNRIAVSLALSSLFLCSAAFAEGGGGASPPAQQPGKVDPKLGAALLPDVYVSDVVYTAPNNDKYTSGPVKMTITITNRSSTQSAKDLRVEQDRPAKDGNGISMLQQVIDVNPKQAVQVALTDPDGLASGCSDRNYTLLLGAGATVRGAAATIDLKPRKVVLHPTCTFTPKIDNPWNLAKPDSVYDIRQKYVYVDNISTQGALTCGTSFQVKGTIINHSAKATSSVAQVFGDALKTNSLGQSVPIAIAAGQYKDFSVSVNPFWGALSTSTFPFRINDAGNSMFYNQGLAVSIEKHCMLVMTLEK